MRWSGMEKIHVEVAVTSCMLLLQKTLTPSSEDCTLAARVIAMFRGATFLHAPGLGFSSHIVCAMVLDNAKERRGVIVPTRRSSHPMAKLQGRSAINKQCGNTCGGERRHG
mmetsp:Transcript_79245/g.220311  ORF Transcript_79245/g.220311 Transcript_79245/m.220311 type:complete len:111 (-) Transcript_79245:21-353(-)